MVSERVQRRIDRLLDQADEALEKQDWGKAAEISRVVLSMDAGNADAATYLAAVETAISDDSATPEIGPPLTETPVGVDNDADNDGVVNELLIGELSAVAIFNTTLERPVKKGNSKASRDGRDTFDAIGCAECHIPRLSTHSRFLPFSFPEEETAPFSNVFFEVDLSKAPANFKREGSHGIAVHLFADLKRHDMGPDLAESFGSDLDSFFTTAKLWGVADSAPYLHDGRALTIGEAISLHGGEAEDARNAFLGLSDDDRIDLLTFLHTLRTPDEVGADLDSKAP